MGNPLLLKKGKEFVIFLYSFQGEQISGSISFCLLLCVSSIPFCQRSLPFSYGNRVLCSFVFSWAEMFFS